MILYNFLNILQYFSNYIEKWLYIEVNRKFWYGLLYFVMNSEMQYIFEDNMQYGSSEEET